MAETIAPADILRVRQGAGIGDGEFLGKDLWRAGPEPETGAKTGESGRQRSSAVCAGETEVHTGRETGAGAARRAAGDRAVHAAMGEIDRDGGEGSTPGVHATG